jgi:trimethylamine--corrinoid protein Co-methyltransferase
LPDFRDPYTCQIRPTLLADVENTAKVVDKMENYAYVSNNGLGSDCNQRIWDLRSLKAMRMYCGKPNLTTATNRENLKAMIDMAAEMAGGYEELRRNPTLMLYNEPVSPLMNSMEAIQKLMLCAEHGIPTTYASGGVSGGTSPVTLSGSIVVSNAECLAGLVIHQLTRKGAPFIYGYIYGAMDMQSTMNVYGGPELGMVHAIMADMARYYDLPLYSTSGCTDALEVDAQAGTEGMFSILCAAMSGGNLVHDNGYTGLGSTGNLSMILLTNEHIGFAKRLIEGIKFDEESLAIDLIDKVGHGGDYISQKHTAKHFREEVYYPKYFNRKMYDAWKAEGGLTLNEKTG